MIVHEKKEDCMRLCTIRSFFSMFYFDVNCFRNGAHAKEEARHPPGSSWSNECIVCTETASEHVSTYTKDDIIRCTCCVFSTLSTRLGCFLFCFVSKLMGKWNICKRQPAQFFVWVSASRAYHRTQYTYAKSKFVFRFSAFRLSTWTALGERDRETKMDAHTIQRSAQEKEYHLRHPLLFHLLCNLYIIVIIISITTTTTTTTTAATTMMITIFHFIRLFYFYFCQWARIYCRIRV